LFHEIVPGRKIALNIAKGGQPSRPWLWDKARRKADPHRANQFGANQLSQSIKPAMSALANRSGLAASRETSCPIRRSAMIPGYFGTGES
jgi:hypothetical protein